MSEYVLRTNEIGIENPPSKEVADCINAWKSWCGDAKLPVWSGGKMLMDLPPKILPLTLIADVVTEPMDFIYRYWGSGFTDMHGFDLTGKSCREIKPEEFGKIVFQAQLDVYTRKAPYLYAGETVSNGQIVINEYVLRTPMSSDGETVNKIMTNVWMNRWDAYNWFHEEREDG